MVKIGKWNIEKIEVLVEEKSMYKHMLKINVTIFMAIIIPTLFFNAVAGVLCGAFVAFAFLYFFIFYRDDSGCDQAPIDGDGDSGGFTVQEKEYIELVLNRNA